jgi:hypothetical protein
MSRPSSSRSCLGCRPRRRAPPPRRAVSVSCRAPPRPWARAFKLCLGRRGLGGRTRRSGSGRSSMRSPAAQAASRHGLRAHGEGAIVGSKGTRPRPPWIVVLPGDDGTSAIRCEPQRLGTARCPFAPSRSDLQPAHIARKDAGAHSCSTSSSALSDRTPRPTRADLRKRTDVTQRRDAQPEQLNFGALCAMTPGRCPPSRRRRPL